MYADYEMADIVLKACAFKPEDRYQTPQELQEALLEYGKRNEASDALIVPPIEGEPEPIDPTAEEEVEPVQFADTEQMADDFKAELLPGHRRCSTPSSTRSTAASAGQDSIGLDENLQDASEDDADARRLQRSRGGRRRAEDQPAPARPAPEEGEGSAPRWLLPVLHQRGGAGRDLRRRCGSS